MCITITSEMSDLERSKRQIGRTSNFCFCETCMLHDGHAVQDITLYKLSAGISCCMSRQHALHESLSSGFDRPAFDVSPALAMLECIQGWWETSCLAEADICCCCQWRSCCCGLWIVGCLCRCLCCCHWDCCPETCCHSIACKCQSL